MFSSLQYLSANSSWQPIRHKYTDHRAVQRTLCLLLNQNSQCANMSDPGNLSSDTCTKTMMHSTVFNEQNDPRTYSKGFSNKVVSSGEMWRTSQRSKVISERIQSVRGGQLAWYLTLNTLKKYNRMGFKEVKYSRPSLCNVV